MSLARKCHSQWRRSTVAQTSKSAVSRAFAALKWSGLRPRKRVSKPACFAKDRTPCRLGSRRHSRLGSLRHNKFAHFRESGHETSGSVLRPRFESCRSRRAQLATLPVRPAFWRAAKTSLSLNSPVTSKLFAFFTAVCSFTPSTVLRALSTAVTHLPQQR